MTSINIAHEFEIKAACITVPSPYSDWLVFCCGKVEVGMSVFMDDIAAVGTADNIKKGIKNCRRIEIEKKMIYG